MTVEKLIEELKKLDPKLEVVIEAETYYGSTHNIAKVSLDDDYKSNGDIIENGIVVLVAEDYEDSLEHLNK